MNAQCYNCHSNQNRNKLILKGGEEVSYRDVQLLCASCHGPTFRDWEKGMHGRTNGYWDSTKGESVRLVCTQCHDPHTPRFGTLVPLPGPSTLRMERGGGPDPDYVHKPKHNPLLLKASAGHEGGASHE
jgi:formate-dependent nitrite reductase cytochrome c552 subunit